MLNVTTLKDRICAGVGMALTVMDETVQVSTAGKASL